MFVATMLIAAAVAAPPQRAVALTFDDIPGVALPEGDGCNADAMRRWNEKLLATLRRHRAPALGLVNSGRACASEQKMLPSLFEAWLRDGHQLGNHTARHRDANAIPIREYEKQVMDGESPLGDVLAKHGQKLVWFRHPFLHSGPTAEYRKQLDDFLATRGYRNAMVTIDNQEFVFADAYARALTRHDAAMAKRVADAYVPFMESVVAFFEKRSREVVGREFPQVILLHMNALNADHLDALLTMIERRGYRFVSINEAMRDAAYALPDGYSGLRGISWIHRWGVAKGMPIVEEPREPEWVAQAAR
jgi:peptidoglycan/xylan/chitin deacetylase (PgdA/CDA1 family)